MGDMIDQNARFETGHVKVMTRAYAENSSQMPNDLALLGVQELKAVLQKDYPNVDWVERIRFGGLIDVPGENGTSLGQGPAAGLGLDIFNKNSSEIDRFNLKTALVSGSLPSKAGEALIGHQLAEKLDIQLGDEITFMGSTMNGSLTLYGFTISGTIRFGISTMDRGAMVIDISDAQKMLDMEDGAGELLGYFNEGVYKDEIALPMEESFNAKYQASDDEFAPQMLALRHQNGLSTYLDMVDMYASLFVTIFIIVMSIVLWNTGLLGGLRRYQEFGIRLALGEEKKHIYWTLVLEAVFVGIIGSIVGTIFGLVATYFMQKYGINIEGMMDDSTMLMPTRLRSEFTPDLFYIGFIPGVLAMVIGNMLSGIGVYKRQTARLMKELEV
jgi:putative ABC transport system permease protein